MPKLEPTINPARLGVRVARFARHLAVRAYNRRRLAHLVEHGEGYSILNDVCHDYGVMLYYITLAQQRRQLAEAGFAAEALAFDCSGQRIVEDTTLDSMALIARKPGAQRKAVPGE